ncbi:MAG: YicC family protein [Sphingobacteriales bacterium]|nr:YicC family protein [Sphingobacteriales bacterium]
MTGYGLASTEYLQKKITVEIRSLNSKFLELNVKMPRNYSEKESTIRNEATKAIERGKANVNIIIEQTTQVESSLLNKDKFNSYYKQLDQLATELGVEKTNLFQQTLSIQDIWSVQEQSADEVEWKAIYNTFTQSIQNFNQFRADEGATLAADLKKRVELILEAIPEVEKFESNRVPAIKDKLESILKDAVGAENVDKNRLEQELIYFIEKYDITEEKIRLKSHCDYFFLVMKEKEANGKKLGFITQEIGREINTMGSKANDASIQKIVVGMKDELEKVKEQLLNII